MRKLTFVLVALLASTANLCAQNAKYPPLSEYMMQPDAEVALAKSAAPQKISAGATIKILTASGYKTAAQGNNGFTCMVMRGWSAPTFTPPPERDLVYDSKLRAPICFDVVASRTIIPFQELRTKLGMEGKRPEQIAEAIQAAYTQGVLPKIESVAFAYMFSADQNLGAGAGHWHPHMMVYTPYYENSMLGGNAPDSLLPIVGPDAGTPFAVTVIPVDDKLAVFTRISRVNPCRSSANMAPLIGVTPRRRAPHPKHHWLISMGVQDDCCRCAYRIAN